MATGRLPDPNTAPVTAKGDLYTYSTVPAKLAVGNNGETLVADSSATTGLRYNPPVGSLANPVINGGFDIWQRGTSFSIAANTMTYTADRWITQNTNANSTLSRQVTNDTTNLPNIQYCMRVQRNSGQTWTTAMQLAQNFENVNTTPFVGKTVTVSFYARKGADYSSASSALAFKLYTGTGTDQNLLQSYTGAATPIDATATLTTTWQRFAYTGTIATTVTEMAPYFTFTPVGTASTNDYFEVTGVQIDLGTYTASTAPSFRRAGGTIAGELAACQRYAVKIGGNANYNQIGCGNFNSGGTVARAIINLPVEMRTAPSSITSASLRAQDTSSGFTMSSVALDTASSKTVAFISGTVSGATAFRFCFIDGDTGAGYVILSAEL